jgi:hypothetical protein
MRVGTFLALALFGSMALAQEQGAGSVPSKVQAILRTNCYRCHGQDGSVEGGFNFVLDRDQMVARQLVIPGDAENSKIYTRVRDGEMPEPGESPRPSEADIAILKDWIDGNAIDFSPPKAKRKFISPANILELINADLAQLKDRNRPFIRYFTITHLYNAGLSEDELQTYRNALSKLVNSLSWGRRVIVPEPIDPAKTILRVDLRDYRWNEKVWEQILAANPYGIDVSTADSTAAAEATQCKLPHVRADWFVASASRPPLYHEVLQLPSTDLELEQLLQVDVAENLRTERVARAGFNGSGVSRNNRLIERHDSPHGAYWKSYDFGGNADEQNLFAHPLGPTGENAFVHDGGELIFSLPNGLQGYMLVDGKGGRIDKGPTSIVSDPKMADRAVVNGLSCMSCHSKGMIAKSDQIRDVVSRQTVAFSPEERDLILALYPPKAEFNRLLKEDQDRFLAAVERTGATPGDTEPIVTLALRFEAELDIKLAAAEAGVPVTEFSRALEASQDLGRTLGILTVEGGTVQRQAFVKQFPSIVDELELGEFLPPGDEVESSTIASTDLKPDGVVPETTSTEETVEDPDREAQFAAIKAALDQLQLIYEETKAGNFKLIFDISDGRTQVVIIQTNTRDYKGLRIRDIWAPAMNSTGPLTAEVGNRLLMDSEFRELGAWEVIPGEEGEEDTVAFTVKVAADATPALIHAALLQAVNTADELERELTGADEF